MLPPISEGLVNDAEASALGADDAGMDDSSDDPDSDPPGGSPVSPAYSPQGDGDGGKSVMDESATESARATGSSGNGSGEMLSTEEMADWHSRLEACQTLHDAINFVTALDALSPEQRHHFESSVPEDTWAWLWNLPEVQQSEPESVPEFLELSAREQGALCWGETLNRPDPMLPAKSPDASSPLPERAPCPPASSTVSEQTVSELKALLLACENLVQLNKLKRTHKNTIALAYSAMSEKEQATVDALAATAVPHRVFKYFGDEIRQGTSRLMGGMLVYLDPQTQVRATAYNAPVWAINGVSSGWKEPVHVSISLLQEVVKAVKPEIHDGGQQMGFI